MEKHDAEPILVEVAEAISDGTPVDWQKQTAGRQELHGRLAHLRLIEEVATAHRTPSMSPQSGEYATAGAARDVLDGQVTADTPPPAPGAVPFTTWGSLRILEPMGSGAFGEVYRAYDPTLQRDVALKLRRADRQGSDTEGDRFLQEGRQLARVRHPGVLVVHGADRHEGRVGLWTDLLRGKTLEEVLAAQGRFGANEAALVGIDLCHSLAAVHAASLVHGDVKAANVMREQGGRIVLMDFGSATTRPTMGDTLKSNDPVSGTPLYMAPEQILHGQPATPSSDIYALGVVLYHLVSGRFPIEAQTWSELHDKHLRRTRTALRDVGPDLPGPFIRVVRRALDPDPAQRFASAGEMEEALAAAIGTAQPSHAGDTTPPAVRARWRPVVATLAVAAVLAAMAGTIFWKQMVLDPLAVEATLLREEPGSEDRLLPGSRLRPGDRLFMEVQSKEPVYAYVLNEDANGESFVLFPAGLEQQNPLSPGETHRLPGKLAGKEQSWLITSAGGRERFLLVASRQPLKDLERRIAAMQHAEAGRRVASTPAPPGSGELLRGAGGMTDSLPRPSDASGGRLSDITRSLGAAAQARKDVWTWQIELENPAH